MDFLQTVRLSFNCASQGGAWGAAQPPPGSWYAIGCIASTKEPRLLLYINKKLHTNIDTHLRLHTRIQVFFTRYNITIHSSILSPYTINLLVHLAGLYAAIAASYRFFKPV